MIDNLEDSYGVNMSKNNSKIEYSDIISQIIAMNNLSTTI